MVVSTGNYFRPELRFGIRFLGYDFLCCITSIPRSRLAPPCALGHRISSYFLMFAGVFNRPLTSSLDTSHHPSYCSDITTVYWGTPMRMGLREANQSFSKAIKAVKSGKDVILTERGKPIAVIKPLAAKDDADAVMRRLEAEGILRRGPKSGKPMLAWRSPIRIKGEPFAGTISEERDER